MIAVDTNLLVRLYVDDGDPQSVGQRQIAFRIMRDTAALFVAKTVLLEFEWVLRGFYDFGRDDIVRALNHLTGLENVSVESESSVLDALRYYQQGIDFADALHAASSSGSERLLTFDRRFISRASRSRVKPRVIAAE